MFAIPIFGMSAPVWLKAAALSGFLMTLAFVVLSILPIVQVVSRVTFALKISAVIVLTNAVGVGLYLRQRRQP
jgi:hypothetical protein